MSSQDARGGHIHPPFRLPDPVSPPADVPRPAPPPLLSPKATADKIPRRPQKPSTSPAPVSDSPRSFQHPAHSFQTEEYHAQSWRVTRGSATQAAEDGCATRRPRVAGLKAGQGADGVEACGLWQDARRCSLAGHPRPTLGCERVQAGPAPPRLEEEGWRR